MATHPKVLGLALDPSTHIYNISVQAHTPLQMIKSLAATGWCKQKGTLMVTYKIIMRPALEYASSIWSPLASTISINKLHDETLILPIHEHLQLHASQYKQKTQHPLRPYTNIQQTSTLQSRYTTHMRHIHISIVSMYLATRGNNKILRTPPPHINSSEEILPRLTRRTAKQPVVKKQCQSQLKRAKNNRLKVIYCNADTFTQEKRHELRVSQSYGNFWKRTC